MKCRVPELLAPAGNLDKLKVAIQYGANAVYLGGQKFGLRAASDNFTQDEILEGVEFAHKKEAKVFVVLNSFLHDDELEELPEFLSFLELAKVDALIVSDLGAIETIKENCSIPIHLSTQASCLNSFSAKLWKKIGVTRVVLGREVTIKEAKVIKEESGLEVEMFVHGSMCMAYSGNCVISNYTSGRDSNRGGCAHSCRFEYSLDFDRPNKNDLKSFFMSSKDLEGVRALQEFIDSGIDSLKIEGRMKSNLYVGTVSKVYSDALKFYQNNGHFLSQDLYSWEKELTKVSHREYSSGSLKNHAGEESVYSEREHEDKNYDVVGNIVDVVKDKFIVLEAKNSFQLNDTLELLPFKEKPIEFKASFIKYLDGEDITKTNPGSLIKIPYVSNSEKLNIVRRRLV